MDNEQNEYDTLTDLEQPENPNISCSYKVEVFLGSKLDKSFYSNYENYRNKHPASHKRDPVAFTYQGYVFSLCTQDYHLKWLDRAETIEEAKLVEHFAQELLLELGFYSED